MKTIQEEVDEINNNFNTLHIDDIPNKQTFSFAVSDKMLKLASKDDTLFGGMDSLPYFIADQAKELQWIPLKLVYTGYFPDECKEENGCHKFYWICEDRSTKNLMNFIMRIHEAEESKKLMKISNAEFNLLDSFDKVEKFVNNDKIVFMWRGIGMEIEE